MSMKVAAEVQKYLQGLIALQIDLGEQGSTLQEQAQELIFTLETVWKRTRKEIRLMLQMEMYQPIAPALELVLQAKEEATVRRKVEALIDRALAAEARKYAQRAIFKLGERVQFPKFPKAA